MPGMFGIPWSAGSIARKLSVIFSNVNDVLLLVVHCKPLYSTYLEERMVKNSQTTVEESTWEY